MRAYCKVQRKSKVESGLELLAFVFWFDEDSGFVSTLVHVFRPFEGRGMDRGPRRAMQISNCNTSQLTNKGENSDKNCSNDKSILRVQHLQLLSSLPWLCDYTQL